MKKLISSLILSIFISFFSTNLIISSIKNEWELKLHYEHISRSLNVDYDILKKILDFQDENNFVYFIDLLDLNISTPGKLNSCSISRSNYSLPNILLTYNKSTVEIVIRHNDKDLIQQCEKYVDREIKRYSENVKIKLKKLADSNIYFAKNYEVAERIKIIEMLKKLIENAKEKSSLDSNDLERISTSFLLINFLSPKPKLNFDTSMISSFNIVDKSYRNLQELKIDKRVLYISNFIIPFVIILIILNFKKLFLRSNSFTRMLKQIFK